MNTLKINGTTLTGIWVDAAVSFNKPAKRVSEYSIPGRNGNLVIDEGTFDNVLITYPVYEKNTFPAEFDSLVNWLASLEGYQRIECSNDPDHFRLGRFVVPETPTAKRLNKDGYYTLTFDCKPQRWLLSGEEDTEIDQNPIDEYSGALISFNAVALDEITELKAAIEPVQNLNGQANPYPAGGGKNLLSPFVKGVAINASNGAEASSTKSATTDFIPVDFTTNPNYYLSGMLASLRSFVAGYNASKQFVHRTGAISQANWSLTSSSFTAGTAQGSGDIVYLRVTTYEDSGLSGNINDIDNMQAQLEVGSSATSYAPYSNICPISGHTEVNVTRTGVNVWDEEWENGSIDNSGNNAPYANNMRSKNYIPIVPNTAYYRVPASRIVTFWYDINKNFISLSGSGAVAITSPSNAYYMRFRTTDGYGGTYNNDISINYPSTDHDYHAYTGQTYLADWGINQWDEEWELGGISGTTGDDQALTDRFRSKNYVPVMPNYTYYVPSSIKLNFRFYGANKGFLGAQNDVKNSTITTPSNCHYVRFASQSGDTTYNNDISINYPSTYTDYHAYADPHVGTVYGGTLNVTTGVLTITHGMIELSDVDWSGSSETRYISPSITGMKPVPSSSTLPNMLAEQYRVVKWADGLATNHDGIAVSNNDQAKLYLYKDASTSTPSGKLVYELVTPTTVQLTAAEVELLLGQNNIWADTGDVEVKVTTPTVFNNPSPFNSKPLIRVYGVGTFRVNDITVTIASHDKPYIDIDCELQECYYEGDNMGSYVTFSGNDFPELVPGNNYMLLASGITKLDVTPRWWIL